MDRSWSRRFSSMLLYYRSNLFFSSASFFLTFLKLFSNLSSLSFCLDFRSLMSSFYCIEKTFCFSSNSFFLLTALIIDSVSHSNFFSFILVTDYCHLKLFSVFSFFVNSLADYALFMPVSNLELILHIAEFIRSVSLYRIDCCSWAERFTFVWNELQCLLDCN